MDGVKILRPSLDDIDKNTVLRGVLEFFGRPRVRLIHARSRLLAASWQGVGAVLRPRPFLS
jgi:hypothetical protein